MNIALITGGSRGLGKSIALHCAEKGNDIILTYNSKQNEAEHVVAEIRRLGRKAVAIRLDVSDIGSFDAFTAEVKEVVQQQWQAGCLYYLINNAGVGVNASVAETTEAQFDMLFNIHLKAPFFLTQKLVPLIKNGGRIINISTGLTRITLPGHAAYAAMKGGVEILTRYMAQEFGSRNITVNTVAPGAIETDFGHGAVRDNKELNEAIASHTALGRVGLPNDIGSMVASLLTEDNRWVTAQRIEVSGGQAL